LQAELLRIWEETRKTVVAQPFRGGGPVAG
jgi:hypothetical protein